MTVIEVIIKDCQYLSNLSDDIEEVKSLLYDLPGIKNLANIVKLYENNYEFNTNELLILLDDLRFLESNRIRIILILLKDRNVNEELIDKYLRDEYKDILLHENLFLTFTYYNIIEALNYFFDEKEINKAVDITVQRDNLESFIFLLDHGYQRNDEILLNLIVQQNGIKILDYLVKNGLNFRINDDLPLCFASENGHLEVVKYFVENGANVNAGDDHSLKMASKEGHLRVVKYLVEKGANINSQNTYALLSASKNGHLEVVKYLIGNGADVNANADYTLIWSSYNGQLEVIKYLVENGANISAQNYRALKYATENEHLEVVKYLVENGANLNTLSVQALKWAYKNEHSEVVKYLKEKKS